MRNEIRVGLTVLVGIVILYIIIAWAKRIHIFAPEETTYLIRFDNVSGLLEDDPVHVRGFLSGRVVSIEPDREYVGVTISLDREINLYQDAAAEIRIKELLGGKMIEITPGLEGNPLEKGAVIPGFASPDFASAFSSFGDISDKIEMDKINQMISRLDTITIGIQGFLANIDPDQTGALINEFSKTATSLNRLIRDFEKSGLTSRLDTSLTRVNRLMARTEPVLNQLEGVSRSAGESSIIPRADSLLGQMTGTLNNLNQTMISVNSLMKRLENDEGLAGRLLDDPALSAKFDSTLDNLNRTLNVINNKRVIVGLKRKKNE